MSFDLSKISWMYKNNLNNVQENKYNLSNDNETFLTFSDILTSDVSIITSQSIKKSSDIDNLYVEFFNNEDLWLDENYFQHENSSKLDNLYEKLSNAVSLKERDEILDEIQNLESDIRINNSNLF